MLVPLAHRAARGSVHRVAEMGRPALLSLSLRTFLQTPRARSACDSVRPRATHSPARPRAGPWSHTRKDGYLVPMIPGGSTGLPIATGGGAPVGHRSPL